MSHSLSSRLSIFCVAIIICLLAAGTQFPAAAQGSPIQINFQNELGAIPAGYLRDYGVPYSIQNGETYGWVVPGTQTPADLTVLGRDRDAIAEQRLDTLMHMDHPNTGLPRGSWEIALPNGAYSVTVSVGDPTIIDSTHQILVEGAIAINSFVPTSLIRHQQNSLIVNVSDGRLTVDQSGGVNTKINYIEIEPAPTEPAVSTVNPTNDALAVPVDIFVAATVYLPSASIDTATVNSTNVYLHPTNNPAQLIPAVVNTTGGGDAIILTPSADLQPFTGYTFNVTSGVQDLNGNPFVPFSSQFTTGSANTGGTTIEFGREIVDTGTLVTSLDIGPDGRLYALALDGNILRWDINVDGTLGNISRIETLVESYGGPRLAIGLVFDPASTSTNPILWISHTTFGFAGMADWGGAITRLSGPDLDTAQDYVVNLPRSTRDHVSNSLEFGPDGALYMTQGSNTAMGAPDTAWGNRPERLLSGALLRIDTMAITSPPLNVQTTDGGSYDPFAPGAPVTVYAQGIRNAYDLLWHSNGSLYVPTNGSAAGGNTPATPATLPTSCATRQDGPYTGPAVPGITGVNQTQADFLFRVVAGGYYGHPNPLLCTWVLNGGNPTAGSDFAEVLQYPAGTSPDPNWRGAAYVFGNNFSPNGIIEYQSNAFDGALTGALLVARYSGGDDIIVLFPDGPNGDIGTTQTHATMGGLSDPLDLVEDPATGNLYISEYGASRIVLLRASDPATTAINLDSFGIGNQTQGPVQLTFALLFVIFMGTTLMVQRSQTRNF